MEQLLDLNASIIVEGENAGAYPAFLKLTETKGVLGTSVSVKVIYGDNMVYDNGSTTMHRLTVEKLLNGTKVEELKAHLQKLIGTSYKRSSRTEIFTVEGDMVLTGIEAIDGAGEFNKPELPPRMWLNPTTGRAEPVPAPRERRRDKGVLFSC